MNDLDPSRPPPRKRTVTDPLEKSLLAMEQQDEADLEGQDQSMGGVVDFEYISRLAKSAGVNIGNRLDEELLSSVNNDPDKYIEIRSNPAKYQDFKKQLESGSNAPGEQPATEPKREMKKSTGPSSIPASQPQPPRKQR